MTKENTNDIEIRKLSAGCVFKLSQMLDCGEGWKQLMAVIPVACKEGNPPKYTVEDMKLIETAGMCQKRCYSEILLEEWGTSGKCRPTISVLLRCLQKAELFRAADFVATELLKVPPPSRPQKGPAAEIKYPSPPVSDFTPSAPPATLSSTCLLDDETVLIQPLKVEVVPLKYADLETVTEGFSAVRVLGGGAWGLVYQANLPSLGAVAIKRLHLTTENSSQWNPQQQFHNEVHVLAQLSHPNLLPLLGYSDDGPALCLAYKFMRNGSLQDRLMCKDSKLPLSWRTRLEIGLGTARGISHLHTALEKPLVHRDIKSANILLDDNFNAKLGDFGLVKLGSSQTRSITVKTTNAVGTSAYMAPEAFRGDVSVKMDIFSFGVVLLELITGLPPHDETREGHDLVTHVDDTDDRASLVDEKAGSWPPKIVSSTFELAFQCLEDKRKRPAISSVIESFNSILT